MSPSELDWRRVTDEAVRILTCELCAEASTDGFPQPFWVGEDYRPGGVVLVARNPASKELPPPAKRLLERLREERDPATFMEWSRWRIAHMTGKPWTQWKLAFAKAVAGCRTPEQLAWLNVTPFATQNDAAPSMELRVHGREQHLAPMLTEVLRPAVVVTRYAAADAAVSMIPGPWQSGGVFPINGRAATNRDTTAIRERLRDRGLCGADQAREAPQALTPPASPAEGLEALRASLLAALCGTAGVAPVETAGYASVGNAPTWAFVERRVGSILIKFRVAPPFRSARDIGARLVQAGVEAHVRDVRSRPGSTRLFVRLHGPTDVTHLRRELARLWRDYQRLR